MSQEHLSNIPRKNEEAADGIASVYVNHVRHCHICLRELMGIRREEAVKHFFKGDGVDSDALLIIEKLQGTIRPTDELFPTLLEVLTWYYLITKPH